MFAFRLSFRTIKSVFYATRSPAIKVPFHLHPRTFITTTQLEMPTTRNQESKEESQHGSIASRTKNDKSAQSDKKDAPGAKPVKKSYRSDAKDCTEHWEDEEHLEQNKKDFQEFREHYRKSSASGGSQSDGSVSGTSGDHGEVPSGMKRGRGANQAGKPRKKTKSENGDGKYDTPDLSRGDKTRVPTVGQKVQWESVPGFVHGEVVEILYENKEVEGKKVEASKEDPRIVLKSDSYDKLAVHKPEDVYFD
jgi:hypothetical protein